jgi:hypothetical protein
MALTSLTSGDRSAGIVRSRTQTTEFEDVGLLCARNDMRRFVSRPVIGRAESAVYISSDPLVELNWKRSLLRIC